MNYTLYAFEWFAWNTKTLDSWRVLIQWVQCIQWAPIHPVFDLPFPIPPWLHHNQRPFEQMQWRWSLHHKHRPLSKRIEVRFWFCGGTVKRRGSDSWISSSPNEPTTGFHAVSFHFFLNQDSVLHFKKTNLRRITSLLNNAYPSLASQSLSTSLLHKD